MDTQVISPKFSLQKSLPSFNAILTFSILIFLAWAFFSKETLRFYASFVFLFYSLTSSMWISVIMLGIFQTILLIPFRIINLTKSKHIRDFEAKVHEIKESSEQSFLIKKNAKTGNRVFLYYIVDFFVQLTSYVSIGRLFLTDFYSVKLSPSMLYSFVPYPEYPIQDRWFKIPYPKITAYHDFGLHTALIVCLVIFALSLLAAIIIRILRKQKNIDLHQAPIQVKNAARTLTGSSLFLMLITYFVLRHFPAGLALGIFSGDVGLPNPTFNGITALATFITILWLDIPTILKKGELAKQAGISAKIVRNTQTQLLGETLRSATVVGLGAYFITNLIPCAFELSIFTLEIISWLSPLTLDRLILRGTPKYEAPIKLELKTDGQI